jgi:Icc-related predicted phosphoesterase
MNKKKKLKLIAIGDSHRQHWNIKIPKCDIFIFAGDAEIDSLLALHDFNDWLGTIKATYRIVVGGNHDRYLEFIGKEECKRLLTNCIYLENESVSILGLKIWGSPFSPLFNDWSFMKHDNDLKEIWDKIPLDTNIVVTHTMPYGIFDTVLPREERVGSITLRDKVKEMQPKIFIGGHLHLSGGQKYTDYKTDYYNVSLLDDSYQLVNQPTTINI